MNPYRTAGLVIVLFSINALAATYYLDSSVASSGNGKSWATAWQNFSNITGLKPGDVVNISGGATGQTYNTGEFLSASGTSGNPITYQAATDASHNGPITINSTGGSQFIYANAGQGYGQWITVNGDVNGTRNITIQGWSTVFEVGSSTGIVLRYLNISNVATGNNNNPIYDGFGSTSVEFDHVFFDLASGADHIVNGPGSGAANYTENLIHDCIFHQRYLPGGGLGDDGFHWTASTSFYNNQWIGIADPSYPGNQHQDGIQSFGPYLAVYDNYFTNMMNYPLYGDATPGNNVQHWRVYNNVIYNPAAGSGSQGISLGCDGATCDQSDLIIANNTVTAVANCIAINNGTSGTFSNNFVVNNICYNAGSLLLPGVSATTSNNTTSSVGITFVNPTSDWHIQAGSTAAIGNGISPSYLTNVYTTDKDGITRTVPWDIGAYRFSGSIPPPPPTSPPTNLTDAVY